MSKVIFTTIKTTTDNRKLKQDKNGYYYVPLTMLNAFNSAGSYYTEEGVIDLFKDKSSALQRRMKNGSLKMEVGHPERLPGMSTADYFARNMKILLSNTCGHIREIVIDVTKTNSLMPGGKPVVMIYGWIKPSGPHGDALKKALDNPEENVAFSIRSFTSDKIVGGINVKQIRQVTTWDWVNEPGMHAVNKWKTLSIESLDICAMETNDMLVNGEPKECFNCSLEDHNEKEEFVKLIQTFDKEDKDKLNEW